MANNKTLNNIRCHTGMFLTGIPLSFWDVSNSYRFDCFIKMKFVFLLSINFLTCTYSIFRYYLLRFLIIVMTDTVAFSKINDMLENWQQRLYKEKNIFSRALTSFDWTVLYQIVKYKVLNWRIWIESYFQRKVQIVQ